MFAMRLGVLALGLSLLSFAVGAAGDEKGEMIDNPMYKQWAEFKPGATVVLLEKTVHTGEDKEQFPDGIEEKAITHKLLKVSPKQVLLSTVVTEKVFLGSVESAPTKTTYNARIKKSALMAVLEEYQAKAGEETIDLLGKMVKCKTLAGSTTKGGTQIEYKLWLAKNVPGGIVKRHRKATKDGKVIAETTIQVRAIKVPE